MDTPHAPALASLLAAVSVGALACAPHPAAAEIAASSASGAWSEPTTWAQQRLPAAGDTVHIARGHRVLYDVATPHVFARVHIEGELVFARDRDTELNVGVVQVGGKPGALGHGVEDVRGGNRDSPPAPVTARLEVGTPNNPIPAGVTARIRLHFLDSLLPDDGPVITCRPGGRMDFHGAPMSRTWLDLGADARPGDTTLTLSEPVSGWRPGDQVIVTGDARDGIADGEFTTEEHTLVAADGARLTLARPLAHPHAGAGTRYRCEVANLTRNVIVESADPDGVRGHTMYHRDAAGSISYARFAHLGKRGVLGRYPIHFHLCRDSLRGESVVGAAIVDSDNRWVTLHNTFYMVVRDCVGYRSVGHGYFLEDGTEVYNVLDRNLGVQAYDGDRLAGQALPFDPNDGAAFWWANGRNALTRNTACENFRYGFRYDCQKRSNFDPELHVRQPDGSLAKTDIRTVPVARFDDNESHTEGLYSFAFAGTEGAGPDRAHPHRLRRNTAWQTHYAMRLQLPTMLVEDADIERAVYGIYRPWFDHHVYRNLRISQTDAEPFNRGLDDRSEQHGPVAVDGLTFAGIRRGGIPFIQLSDYNVGGDAETHVRGLTIEDRRDGEQRALVDMGGGARTNDAMVNGVPVVIHDLFGPGAHARFVSSRDVRFVKDKARFREQPPLTGEESRVADDPAAEFPELLAPVDDQPPSTAITWPPRGLPVRLDPDGTLEIRGTSTDDDKVAAVTVNGVVATDADYDFTEWRARIGGLTPGTHEIVATAVDAAGNREQTPHRLVITIMQ